MGVIEFIGIWAPWGCLSWLHVTSPVAPCGLCLGVLRPPVRTPCARPLRPKGHMCQHAAMTHRCLGSVGLVVSFARTSAPMVASCVRSFGRSAGSFGVHRLPLRYSVWHLALPTVSADATHFRFTADAHAFAPFTSLPISRPLRPPLRFVRARCLGLHPF